MFCWVAGMVFVTMRLPPTPGASPTSVLNSSDVPMTHLVLGFAVEGNAPPPKKITSWFLSKGQGKTRDDSADYIPHDIYVIGTQEDPLGEKEWLEILKNSLQEITSMTFKTVSSCHGPGWDSGAVGSARPARSISEARAARPIGSQLPKMPQCSAVPPLTPATFQGQRGAPAFRNRWGP